MNAMIVIFYYVLYYLILVDPICSRSNKIRRNVLRTVGGYDDLCTQESPYITLKNRSVPTPADDVFDGYIVQLLERFGVKLNKTFNIQLVADGQFGSKDDGGNWNGLIGEVLSGVSGRVPRGDRDGGDRRLGKSVLKWWLRWSNQLAVCK